MGSPAGFRRLRGARTSTVCRVIGDLAEFALDQPEPVHQRQRANRSGYLVKILPVRPLAPGRRRVRHRRTPHHRRGPVQLNEERLLGRLGFAPGHPQMAGGGVPAPRRGSPTARGPARRRRSSAPRREPRWRTSPAPPPPTRPWPLSAVNIRHRPSRHHGRASSPTSPRIRGANRSGDDDAGRPPPSDALGQPSARSDGVVWALDVPCRA